MGFNRIYKTFQLIVEQTNNCKLTKDETDLLISVNNDLQDIFDSGEPTKQNILKFTQIMTRLDKLKILHKKGSKWERFKSMVNKELMQ